MTTSLRVRENRSPMREVLAYLIITYSLALTIALALPHAHLNLLLSVLTPTVAVTILTFTMFERGTRRALWRSFGLTRTGLGSWLPAMYVPVLLCGGAYGAALLLGAGHWVGITGTRAPLTGWALNTVISTAIMAVVLLGEEIGWRGYMLPRVQQVTDRSRAALITGLAHGLFHLPLILLATTYDTGITRWIAAPAAVLTITTGGVFYAWLRDRSGSIWPVALAHSCVNSVFDIGAAAVVATAPASLAYVAGETGFATSTVCVILAAVLLKRANAWPADRTPHIHEAPLSTEAV